MYNLKKNNEINSFIRILERDNEIIVKSIDEIYDTFIKIDKNDWYSPEKIEMDRNFIPYLKEESKYLKNEFDDKINFLKNAIKSYDDVEKKLKKKADDLEVL